MYMCIYIYVNTCVCVCVSGSSECRQFVPKSAEWIGVDSEVRGKHRSGVDGKGVGLGVNLTC